MLPITVEVGGDGSRLHPGGGQGRDHDAELPQVPGTGSPGHPVAREAYVGVGERAIGRELPKGAERACRRELPEVVERAVMNELPEVVERAVMNELPVSSERAADQEPPRRGERAEE